MLRINKEFTLPKDFKEGINLNLLAQAVYVYEDGSHVGFRNTKTRSEVNRTKKKVYKQKGTGGARHGSRRANVFVGGGVVFGPRPVKRVLTLSRKLRKVSRKMALTLKAKEKEVIVAGGFSTLVKTKEAADFVKGLAAKSVTFVLSDKNAEKLRFLRNLESAKAVLFRNLNTLDIVKGGVLVMDADTFKSERPEVVKRPVRKAAKKTR